MKGVTVLLSNELRKGVDARIAEKNMTIQQYIVDLIKQDLATTDNKKPVVATMYDENDELCDYVLNTDMINDATLSDDEKTLLNALLEISKMQDIEK